MERLKDENCQIVFNTKEDMTNFLTRMEAADETKEFRLNTISTKINDDGDWELTGENIATGMLEKVKLWPFSIKSLEKRSGDTAQGHKLMTDEQILNSLNNYWGLYDNKKIVVARIRGEKAMALDSVQYEPISQAELISAIIAWLEDRHADAYEFIDGEYSHLLTYANFEIDDAISPGYKASWRKAGLSESLLDSSKITVSFLTDDTENCSAKAIIELIVGGTKFLIGNPIGVMHRKGHGGADAFKDALNAIDVSVRDELDALSNLMSINLLHPEAACIKALKKAKIPEISKKATDELVDDMFFGATETAYIVYLYLHGVLDTEAGRNLPAERKMRVTTALRTLLKEDWKKFDVPSASL